MLKQEIKGTKYQTIIKDLLGRPVTREEALQALQLHNDGDGGNTIGWKYDAKVNNVFKCDHKQHTKLGDCIINLGRLVSDNPELKWCFPETYEAYKKPENEGNVKNM